ncbi:uncharacterized protein LOC113286671 isoform X2 [Papaver somniferum]|uniref:uncharacterized protein LOC113286671 isoform X2 n=1 Tax=Papaver somniferum TaxID=3469 RepID=UPI000E6FEAF3|nr:uncharacterized protein LOC113286671 isoform X2 [Papaver somniferum]
MMTQFSNKDCSLHCLSVLCGLFMKYLMVELSILTKMSLLFLKWSNTDTITKVVTDQDIVVTEMGIMVVQEGERQGCLEEIGVVLQQSSHNLRYGGGMSSAKAALESDTRIY